MMATGLLSTDDIELTFNSFCLRCVPRCHMPLPDSHKAQILCGLTGNLSCSDHSPALKALPGNIHIVANVYIWVNNCKVLLYVSDTSVYISPNSPDFHFFHLARLACHKSTFVLMREMHCMPNHDCAGTGNTAVEVMSITAISRSDSNHYESIKTR